MKSVFVFCCSILLLHVKNTEAKPYGVGERRCVNMWDEGCINGQLPGAGGDDNYLNGGFNPGKRCIDVWDEGCNNGPAAEDDGNIYLGDSIPPERRFLYELLNKLHGKHQLY